MSRHNVSDTGSGVYLERGVLRSWKTEKLAVIFRIFGPVRRGELANLFSTLGGSVRFFFFTRAMNQRPAAYVYRENGILPAHVGELLDNWPPTHTGYRQVHRHILKLANHLRHYVPAEKAVELIRAKLPRRPKGREIEETVMRAYNLQNVAKIDSPPTYQPDVALIEQIVAERISAKSALVELEEKSPSPIPDSTGEIMHQLFSPEDLICHACDFRKAVTRQLPQIFWSNNFELVVPNPMSARYVIDKEGRRHNRSLANTGPRRYLVCDIDIKPGPGSIYNELIQRWAKYGVSIQDAAAALIGHLSEHGPLTMVVHSGNISLQAWFYCQGESESANSNLRVFFENAVILGADRAGWTRCQLFRMPGATRSNTGRRQSVHYFNPETINHGVEVDEDQDEHT